MKLVKKILRLLPLLFLIGALLSSINYSRVLSPGGDFGPIFHFENEMGAWDGFNDCINLIVSGTPFENLLNWVTNNISNSYFISWSFCILCYELFLSLLFLMFDFINMVFGWANKLIDKGAKSVE